MKKLMLSSMILLPLILLLILSLSTAFVSLTSYIYVDSVEILDADEILYMNKKTVSDEPQFQLVTNVFPMFASNKELIYTCEDDDILSVNADGIVTAHNYGTTYVKIQSKENNTKESKRRVVVTDDQIQDLKVENLKTSMYVGEEYMLHCTALPVDAKDKVLLYTSSNPDVLAVTMSGELKAKAYGDAVITIIPHGNDLINKSFTISVKEKLIDVKPIDQNTKITLDTNKAKFSKLLISPKNADVEIRYESSDESIATIDNDGNIEFIKSGQVTLSAIVLDNSEIIDGEKKKYVFDKEYSYYSGYVQDLEIQAKSSYDYDEFFGKALDIKFIVDPIKYDKNNLVISLLDESSENVLSINTKNEIRIKNPGIATIKVLYYTSPGKYTQLEKTIEITRKAQDINFSNELNQGLVLYTFNNNFNIQSTLIPNNATFGVNYSTLDKDVKINGNQILFNKGLEYKEVEILATTNNGELKKSFKVIYINKDKVQALYVKNDQTFDITLPKSHISDKTVKIALVPDTNEINSVEIKEQDTVLSIINLNDIGTKEYLMNVNGTKFANVKLNAIRLVEDIKDIIVTDSVIRPDGTYYTAANSVSISSTLYPLNTTIKDATYEIKSGNAIITGNEITFNSIGEIKVLIKADIVKEITIYSTLGHPDKDVKFIDSKIINKGDTLKVKDLVKTLSPFNASLDYFDIETSSPCLKNDLGVIKGIFGGDGEIKVTATLDSGTLTKIIKVKVLENPESITLNKNYFVVNTDRYTVDKLDFNILPITANNNLNYTVSCTKPGVIVKDNDVIFNGTGLVDVIITINNIKTNLSLLFKGNSNVIDFNKEIQELPIGDKFIANIPTDISKNYNGISNLNGLIYKDGIFEITKAVVSPANEYSASFDVASCTFKVKGYIKAKGLSFDVLNNGADKMDNTFVTANKEINVKATTTNLDATYKDITYEIIDDIATITKDGHITFNKAGEIVVNIKHVHEGIMDSIKLRYTGGLVESVSIDVNEVTLDFDDPINNSISLMDKIKVFPSQANLNENIKLSLYSGDIVSIDNSTFTLTALKGGESYVLIQYKDNLGEYKASAAYFKINVKRKATGIKFNGNSLLPTQKIEVKDTGFVQFKTQAEPIDANVGTNIVAKITRGQEFGLIEDSNLIFLAKDKEIDVTFTLGDSTQFVVTFIATGVIDIQIDLSQKTIVVPYESEIVFLNKPMDYQIPESLFKLNTSNGKYKAQKSVITTIVVGGEEKNLIITKRTSHIDNVYVMDFDNTTKTQVELKLLDKHITASKDIKLYTKQIDNYNKDGNLVSVQLSVDNLDVASLNNDVLTFNKAGKAIITATINGIDFYGSYQVVRKIEIESTYGLATDFKVNDVELIDQFSYDLSNKISINRPLYGADDVTFKLSSNDMTISGLVVDATKTGINKVDIISTNGINTILNSINIKIDISVSDIVFNKGSDKILYDITNLDSYVFDLELLSASKYNPTLNKVTYAVQSGDASVLDNAIKFNKDYTVAQIKVTAESGVAKTFTLVKVPNDVTVIDVKNDSKISIKNNTKYAFNIIGKAHDITYLDDPNITIVNSDTLTLSFNHGGLYTYTIKGQVLNFIISERVDKVFVSENELAISENKYLTASKEIDLDLLLKPAYSPSTAYSDKGQIKIEYSIVSGNAKLVNNKLVFNSQGVTQIKVKADDKFIVVSIESTMGYVKDAKFIGELNKHLKDKQFEIAKSDFTVYPIDVDNSKYSFSSISDNIKVNGNVVTMLSEGLANITLNYQTNSLVTNKTQTGLYVHNPISDVVFNYNGYDINRIILPITNGNKYQLNYSFKAGTTTPKQITFKSNDILSVDNNGLVTFNKVDVFSVCTIQVINLDGSTYTEDIELMLTEHPLVVVDDKTNEQELIKLDAKDLNAYIFALPIQGPIKYEVIGALDIININQDGLIEIIKGGNSKVKVSNDIYQKELDIFIHKETESIDVKALNGKTIKGNAVYTALKELDLNATLMPLDSNYNKQVTYNYDKGQDVAYMNGNTLVFKKAGEISVEVIVTYDGTIECNLIINIISTFGELDSYKLVDENNKFFKNYVFETLNVEHSFKFIDLVPNDYAITNFDVINQNGSNAIDINKTQNGFNIKSIGKGTGTIKVLLDNIQTEFNFDAKIKVSSILIGVHNFDITNGKTYLTMLDTLNITKLIINPIDANDQGLTWNIDGDGKILDNKIMLPSNKVYTITISSNDKGASVQFKVERVNALQEFNLHYQLTIGGLDNKQVVQDVVGSSQSSAIMNVRPSHNESIVLLNIENLPINFIGDVETNAFKVNCPAGINYTLSHNIISVTLPSGVFNDNIIVQSGNAMITVNIFRDGITAIDFKNHDNANDLSYGLQQVRLFGNKSYYDGAVQNYYKLPVEVSSLSGNAIPVFQSSNSRVTLGQYSNGILPIYFNNFGNSATDIYNNNFSQQVRITATDQSGVISYSYNFHVVRDFVNVFDIQGLTTQNDVVLHKHFESPTEISAHKNTQENYVEFNLTTPLDLALDPNKNKRHRIIGNGYTINFYAVNEIKSLRDNSGRLRIEPSQTINCTLKGTDFDKTKKNYHIHYMIQHAYYTKFMNSSEGIHMGSDFHIVNCLFMYIQRMSVQNATWSNNTFVENVMSLDGGWTMIDCQANDMHIKGFVDAYNFQSADGLKNIHPLVTKPLANLIISDFKRDHAAYGQMTDTGEGINTVIFVHKEDKNKNPINLKMYNGKDSNGRDIYIEKLEPGANKNQKYVGTEYAAPGLTRLTSKSLQAFGHICSYNPTNTHFTYAHQKDYGGWMARQQQKVLRTYSGSLFEPVL